MPKKTHLDVLVLTAGANDFVGRFKALEIQPEVQTADGRAVGQRYGLDIPTKKQFSLRFEELVTSSGAGAIRQSGLNLTVLNVAGTSVLGRSKGGGSLSVTTETAEVDGDADEWVLHQAVGTTYQMEANLQIVDTAAYAAAIFGAGISGLLVTAGVTVGGVAFSAPMTLKSSGHGVDQGQAQTERVTLSNRGTPTVASGNPLLAAALLGSPAYTVVAGTGAGQYTCDMLVRTTALTWSGGQLVSARHEFVPTSAPTYA